jgi:carbamoyl-phosphate synthase small subunit
LLCDTDAARIAAPIHVGPPLLDRGAFETVNRMLDDAVPIETLVSDRMQLDPTHSLDEIQSSDGDAVALTLEDGTVLRGRGFGALRPVGGEVVFNTAMAGYVEALTDPSYCGQILVLTYPLVGNYGVPAPRMPDSLDAPYESDRVQVQALVVQNYVEAYSHHAASRSLHDWLAAEGIPGLTGVDTRSLTRRLRERGTMRGLLHPASMHEEEARACADTVDMRDEVFRIVAPRKPVRYGDGRLTILVVDAGAKDHIVRSLLVRGASVLRAPWHADLAALSVQVDGILLGNGPGDPKDLSPLVAQVRALLDSYAKPIFGVCLGNQILALAAGADTYKLPYGHRGVNQPVQDLVTRRCYVTSQNHGYAVQDRSLPKEWEPWFVNINDGTNEGIRCRGRPFFSVQFHPEAHPGPQDTGFLFDDFLRLVQSMARA